MRSRIRRAAGVAFLLVVAAHRPLAAQALDSVARVDSVFARWNTRQSPGCVVSVMRDATTIVERAYGMADLERGVPNTLQTIFEAGSVSKQFTAGAILLLTQQSHVTLDDDVRRYLPELPDYGTPITLRHMLNHTSGLRDWGAVAAIGGWPRGTRLYTQRHVLEIARRQRALNFPPGAEYLYSNTNFNLLATIVERVSGMSFAEFTRRNIFEPLAMSSTSWRDDYQRIVPGRAVAYSRAGGVYRIDHPAENAHGNGGLLTTVADLQRWNANFATSRVGGAGFVSEQERRGTLTNGRTIQYASGLFVTNYRGVREVMHDGATAGYRAFLARYPDQRLAVALLCNAGEADPSALGDAVAELFLTGLAPRPAPPTARVTLTEADLAPRAGLYRSTRTLDPLRLVIRDGALRTGGGQALVPLAPDTFAFGPVRLAFVTGSARPWISLITPVGDTTRYEPVDPVSPTPQQLADYVGSYHSDEADFDVTLAVNDSGRVAVRSWIGQELPLVPSYRDVFTSSLGLFSFTRDATGRVNGFGVWQGRARNVRYERR